MIFLIFHTNISCDTSLELSRQDGSKEGYTFLLTNEKNIFELSSIPLLIWSSDGTLSGLAILPFSVFLLSGGQL